MDNNETESPEESNSAEEESYRVNVPAADAAALAEGPDSGFALVKFTKDGNGYCLDLKSLRLPEEQPVDEEQETEEEMPLENLARKVAQEKGINVED